VLAGKITKSGELWRENSCQDFEVLKSHTHKPPKWPSSPVQLEEIYESFTKEFSTSKKRKTFEHMELSPLKLSNFATPKKARKSLKSP
jgi:hypothetical protein